MRRQTQPSASSLGMLIFWKVVSASVSIKNPSLASQEHLSRTFAALLSAG